MREENWSKRKEGRRGVKRAENRWGKEETGREERWKERSDGRDKRDETRGVRGKTIMWKEIVWGGECCEGRSLKGWQSKNEGDERRKEVWEKRKGGEVSWELKKRLEERNDEKNEVRWREAGGERIRREETKTEGVEGKSKRRKGWGEERDLRKEDTKDEMKDKKRRYEDNKKNSKRRRGGR